MTFSVIVEKGWSYIVGPRDFRDGPWRYKWEAQERADQFNTVPPERIEALMAASEEIRKTILDS